MNGSAFRYGVELRHECRSELGSWMAAGAVVGAVVIMAVAAVALIRTVKLAAGRQKVEWMAVYPDPVCEWCGGVMDGRGCTCEGVEQ